MLPLTKYIDPEGADCLPSRTRADDENDRTDAYRPSNDDYANDQCKMASQSNAWKLAVLNAFLFINGTCSLFDNKNSSKTLLFTLGSQPRVFRDSNWKCVVVISAIDVYSKQLRDLNIFGNILAIKKS